ncbi:unnamed protein product, partial [Timema podura]|nr:unnamed protein product [Timema podura]
MSEGVLWATPAPITTSSNSNSNDGSPRPSRFLSSSGPTPIPELCLAPHPMSRFYPSPSPDNDCALPTMALSFTAAGPSAGGNRVPPRTHSYTLVGGHIVFLPEGSGVRAFRSRSNTQQQRQPPAPNNTDLGYNGKRFGSEPD